MNNIQDELTQKGLDALDKLQSGKGMSANDWKDLENAIRNKCEKGRMDNAARLHPNDRTESGT